MRNVCFEKKVKEESRFSKLKILRRRLKETSKKIENLKKEREKIEDNMSKNIKDLQLIKNEIEDIENDTTSLEVTDHARVQFFNRCLGFDIDKIDEVILNERTKEAVSIVGSPGKFPFKVQNIENFMNSLLRQGFNPKENYACRIRNGMVVTVIED